MAIASGSLKGGVLVTGATGFIGKHLVDALRAQGEHVVTHSRSKGDVASDALPSDPVRHVFHLCAKTFVPDSWDNPLEFFRVNTLGTVNVLDFCRRRNAALTLVSSYVYGQPATLPISEEHPLAAANPYAESKILAENAARWYERIFGIPLSIVRPFNVYGPGQAGMFLIPSLVNQVLSAEAAQIEVQDLEPRRDYLFVDDLVDLLLILLRRPGSGTFNAGSGASVNLSGVLDIIQSIAGTNKPLIARKIQRTNEIPDVTADISKAKRRLGWAPRVSLREGLMRMIIKGS